MRLEIWMQWNKRSSGEVAKLFNVSQAHIHKYLYEDTIPKRKIMMNIFKITQGAVTPNDFYGCDAGIFEQPPLSKRNE
ncbi:hypothetical protein [Candidatus Tisiphia endosymbiont of Sialis lutaria]|uniref:hypothetical protein n=1 Tax=Candidatus Tisiphia endosymbiont of Sialis lutaria TaxID=2029164 RepID=UPI00312C8931